MPRFLLDTFEMLMAMDDASFAVRFGRISPRKLVERVALVKDVFSNQALNTLFQYGTRASENLIPFICKDYKSFPLSSDTIQQIVAQPADCFSVPCVGTGQGDRW
jgi:hypothetical protein